MPQLQEETARRQLGLPALRPAVTKHSVWIYRVAAIALAVAAICDWTQPPRRQVSVVLYEKLVIGGYRLLVRPATHYFVHCRFQPTCSRYSVEAVHAYGLPKGLWLTTSRLFRCLPWVPFGTRDPIPLLPKNS
ncbi:MAG: membrane protein insertion efficiency factor YidD [Verrucomicrobiota bacterium]